MKKTILLITLFLGLNRCFAQDTVRRHNRLTQTIKETFYVLKTDKTVKQGLYQAIYKGNIALASGLYIKNARVGIWHFYDTQGTLVQNFDYNHNRIVFEKADDDISARHINYSFDNKITDSDRVTKPMKVGGRCYGYIPYLKIFRLSNDYIGTDLSQFSAILEILVSPGGRLADFKVHILSQIDERVTSFSPTLIDNEDKLFVPATINYKPVLCRIFVKCRITDDGELDVF